MSEKKDSQPEQWLGAGALIAVLGLILDSATEGSGGVILMVVGGLLALVGVIGLGVRIGNSSRQD